jgi:Ca-activated chloride channel homolog
MAGTLLTVAKDVKLQIEFNPARVKAYRLIGYENRVLRPEEFNDDKKDAGDIGAGTAVTALYEIIPAGSREELPCVDELRYQKTTLNPAAARNPGELATLKFRYKDPGESKSRLLTQRVSDSSQSFTEGGAEMRFASAVAEYGLLLRGSRFAGAASFDHVLAVAEHARGRDIGGYRREFVDLVRAARELARRGGASD